MGRLSCVVTSQSDSQELALGSIELPEVGKEDAKLRWEEKAGGNMGRQAWRSWQAEVERKPKH